jgi:hypothetical protein
VRGGDPRGAAQGGQGMHPLHPLPGTIREGETVNGAAEMGLIESIINTLGAPGLILACLGAPCMVMCFMYADHRRYERERLEAIKADSIKQLEHHKNLAQMKEQYLAIIAQQERRFEIVIKNYENNVILVESYQKLANELAGIIHMSTMVLTKLVEKIDNNLYCPMVKEKR